MADILEYIFYNENLDILKIIGGCSLESKLKNVNVSIDADLALFRHQAIAEPVMTLITDAYMRHRN